MRNANKSPKSRSTMGREIEQWSRICIQYRIISTPSKVNHF